MDRRDFLALAAASLLPLSAWGENSKFEQFLKDQNGGFNDYQKKLEKDFKAYQLIQKEETTEYQRRIKALWGDDNIGSAKILVFYSKDLKTRSLVNYETGLVAIETLGSKAELNHALDELAHSNSQLLFTQNELEQRVAKKLLANTEFLKNSSLNPTLIIADMLTGKVQPNTNDIDKALVKAHKKAHINTKTAASGTAMLRLTLPLNTSMISKKADQYRDVVEELAKKEQISPALVLAVMHTESNFNPLARSSVPAFGLMQIVPGSAGKDASAYVYGKAALLSPAYLYNSDNNIKMGCAYLHILQHNYLSDIDSAESKLYCTIAAYNTGAGNVARAFTGTTNIKKAAQSINKMKPSEVYRHLSANLLYQETRDYLKRVTGRYQAYLV